MKYVNNKKVLWIGTDNVQLYLLKKEFLTIKLGKLFCSLPLKSTFSTLFPRLYRLRRTFLPSFVQVNLHDCDNGGHVFASYPALVWNVKHYCNTVKHDGETSSYYISFINYVRWKLMLLTNRDKGVC